MEKYTFLFFFILPVEKYTFTFTSIRNEQSMELALVSNPLMEPKEYFHSEKSSQEMNCETDSPMAQWQPNIFCYLLSAVEGFSHKFFLKAIWSLVVLPDTDHWDAVEVEPSPFMKLKMVWNQLRWLFQPVAHCGRGQTWNIWTSQLSGGWIWILEPLKWK